MSPPEKKKPAPALKGGRPTPAKKPSPPPEEDEVTATGKRMKTDGFEGTTTQAVDTQRRLTGEFRLVMDEPGRRNTAEVRIAPEASQGRYRERVYRPRAIFSTDEILEGLRAAVASLERRNPAAAKGPAADSPWAALGAPAADKNDGPSPYAELRHGMIPFLRQAVEQAGGDGVDVYLQALGDPPGRTPTQPLFKQIIDAGRTLGLAPDVDGQVKAARLLNGAVRSALNGDLRAPMSFKVMERVFEGRVELDELLEIVLLTSPELDKHILKVAGSLERLRMELRASPGEKPGGLFWNFGRMKAEARILAGELARRQAAGY